MILAPILALQVFSQEITLDGNKYLFSINDAGYWRNGKCTYRETGKSNISKVITLTFPDGLVPTTPWTVSDEVRHRPTIMRWNCEGIETVVILAIGTDNGVYDFISPVVYAFDHGRLKRLHTGRQPSFEHGTMAFINDKLVTASPLFDNGHGDSIRNKYLLEGYSVQSRKLVRIWRYITKSEYRPYHSLEFEGPIGAKQLNLPEIAEDPFTELGLRWQWWASLVQPPT